MGMETRIGIATGLLIVVVAGVYFFYGTHRAGEDLLITLDSAGPPPKIPISHQSQKVKHRHPTSRTQASAKRAPGKMANRPTRARPVRSRHSVRGNHGKSAGRSAKLPRRNPSIRPPSALSRQDRSTRASNNTRSRRSANRQNALPHKRPVTVLKSGPSQQLISATSKNLQTTQRQARPQTTRRLDGIDPHRANRPSADEVAKKSHPSVTHREETRRSGNHWPKQHTITAGDTLTSISNRYYSTRKNIPLILKANPQIKNPKALKIGDILSIPTPPPGASTAQRATDNPSHGRANALQAKAPTRSGPSTAHPSLQKTYRVRKGDTFYSIAQRLLGSSKRWKELYDPNRALVKNDPKRLSPGMTLILPQQH